MQIGESLDELADSTGDAFPVDFTFLATSLTSWMLQCPDEEEVNQIFDTVFFNGYFGLFVSALSFLSILFCSYTQAF